MKNWIRSVVPDLCLAAVVALLVTMAIQQLDGAEVERIRTDAQTAAEDGLTLDERIDVYDGSIRALDALPPPGAHSHQRCRGWSGVP